MISTSSTSNSHTFVTMIDLDLEKHRDTVSYWNESAV